MNTLLATINDITNSYEYHKEQMIKAKDTMDFNKASYHQTYMCALDDVLIYIKRNS